MDLSVIIISFNTKELLQQCIESVRSTKINALYEIIVVDNASTDGSAEMVERKYRDILLIRNSENVLFSKANNQAMALARGKYLLLLNSDAIVRGGAIELLMKFMAMNKKAAAVGPKVLNIDGTLQSKGFPLLSIRATILRHLGLNKNIIPKRIKQKIFSKYFWYEDDIVNVGWVAGCCILMRRDIIEKIGGLCEELPFYGEEIEWCYRATGAGYEVWYVPTAEILHIGGASTKESLDDNCRLQNYKLLFKKTIGVNKGIVLSVATIIIKCFKYLLALILKPGFAGGLLREVKWETVVLRYFIKNANS